jgi:hypothetical protein
MHDDDDGSLGAALRVDDPDANAVVPPTIQTRTLSSPPAGTIAHSACLVEAASRPATSTPPAGSAADDGWIEDAAATGIAG